MQERVYQKPARNVDELKQRLIAAWLGVQQSVIDQAMISVCVKAKSKHFEHLF